MLNQLKKLWAWQNLAYLVVLGVLGWGVWMLVEQDIRVLIFPYPVDYGEGPLLDQALRLASFQNVYRADVSVPPYTIANYPPIFLVAQLPFAWIFGPALWYGRLLSFISILVAALMVGLTIHALTKSKIAGVIGGLFLLSLPYILYWGIQNRIDSLALAFCTAGMYAAAANPQSRKQRILSAILLVLATYTRQSYGLAAPLAVFIYLLVEKPRRKAFEFAAWFVGLGLGSFLILTLVTRGGFYFNIVTANLNPFSWDQVKHYANEIWDHMPLYVIGNGLFLLSGVRWRSKAWWLLAPFLVGAVADGITIGKDGSNVNYLFELCGAFALVIGAILAWARQKNRWLNFGLLFAVALQTYFLLAWTQTEYYSWRDDRLMQMADIDRLNDFVKNAPPGPVLADEYMGLLPVDGRPLYYQPFEFKMLSDGKVWDQKSFLQDIQQKKFTLILLYDPPYWDSRHARWTPEELDYIEQNYSWAFSQAETTGYKPR